MKHTLSSALLLSAVATMAVAQTPTCTVKLDEVHQLIQGFGGINHPCWTNYDLTNNDIDKLFGVGDGKLGLSVMRIWVAESSNQWSREVSTCKKVQKMGVKIFATPWNPPTNDMTQKYNCTQGNCPFNINERDSEEEKKRKQEAKNKEKQIKTEAFEQYTQHLISFNNYMKDQGVSLYAMSFANEPDYGHEWTTWTNDQVYDYAKNYAGRLRINGTKVITAESFAYQKAMYDKILNDPTALKNIDILGTHFYASIASTSDGFFKYTLGDQKIAADPEKEVWMTEYYTSSNSTNGSPCRANVWPEALDVAYSIHRGMAISNLSAYVWWYLKRNYSLINNGDTNNQNGEDGQITKRGWLFGQFARFIRPGYHRVGCTINPTYNLYTSAYKNGEDVVIVAVNMSTESKTVTINVPGTSVKTWNAWITDETRNMKKLDAINGGSSFTVTVPPKSCVTYVGEGNSKVKLSLSAAATAIEEGDTILIEPTYSSEGGEVKNIQYFEGEERIKDKWVAPFAWYYGANATIGEHTIKAVAYDSNNESAESAIVINVVKKRKPFNGEAQRIPGIIEAENFDEGANEFAFYDADEKNNGDASYRSDSNVDVYVCEGGYAVGYCEAGEWLKYTIEVEKDGKYTFSANVSDDGDPSSFSLQFDGDKDNKVIFESEATEAWNKYKEITSTQEVELSAGTHEMLITIESSWVNIDWIKAQSKEDVTYIMPVNVAVPAGEYMVYDARGNVMGRVKISSEADFNRLPYERGVYLLKSNSKTYKVVKR